MTMTYERPLKGARQGRKPVNKYLIVILFTFILQFVIISFIDSQTNDRSLSHILLDCLIMVGLQSPLIYFLMIRPTIVSLHRTREEKKSIMEREQYFRTLTDAGDALVWAMDKNRKFTYVNKTWLAFTGRTKEQDSEEGLEENIHPDDRQRSFETFECAFEAREKFSIKFRLLHCSGEYRWILNNGVPCFDYKGEFNGYMGHCLDIEEHMKAEEHLKTRERDYRSIFELSPIAAFFWNKEGIIIFWNKAAEKTFGWTKEEVIGQPITQFFKPNYYQPEVNYNIQDALHTYNNATIIKEYVRKDGVVIVCEWHKTPIYDRQGNIIKMISQAKDITEQKRFEAELLKAREKAEESERLKSAFLANMSHELRSPLNSIIGFSELLADPDFDEQQKIQFATLINKGGNNLLATISDLMDFSKIEAGQMDVNRKNVVIHDLLKDLVEEYSFKAREKGIVLKLLMDAPQGDVVLYTDEMKIRQVLVNFLANALKFTEEGSVELGLQISGSMARFYVRDTGIGIPKQYQDILFERFRQVASNVSRKQKGTGLGLAISKSLVEMLGGHIGVSSDEGVGSVFYFVLPLGEQPTAK